jgi:8-oxo-dGTP diphosphatase
MESVQRWQQEIVGALDRYQGLEVTDMASLLTSEEDFARQLEWNLARWVEKGVRSVQIRFTPPGHCQLMNAAFKQGFYFHHAHRKENYVLMCKWLDATTHDKMPAYADHYVGVGGVVINNKDEILLIQERRQPEPRQWKFPGGFMDPGETIKQAAEREVFEETGVKTVFQGILGLREMDAKYTTTDFYIVCLLTVPDECDA